MRFAIAAALVLCSSCKIESSTGGGASPPMIGVRYSCTVDRSCGPGTRATIASEPCAEDRAAAEDLAIDVAACAACVCIVDCHRQSPPRLCAVHVDAGAEL